MNNKRPTISYPPRKIPFDLSVMLILGNFVAKFGFYFFGFGLIFVWIFGLDVDYTSWYKFRGDVEEVSGMITDSDKSDFSEGGSRIKNTEGTPVYKYSYSYTDKNGLEHKGISYSTIDYDKKVTVQYLNEEPDYSRIKGAQRKPLSLFFGGIIFIFPIFGILATIVGIKKGMFSYFLLKHGYPAEAKVVKWNSTGRHVNDQEVIEYELEFSTRNGRKCRSIFKTHLTDNIGDEDTELVFYDPYSPERSLLFDGLSTKPLVDEEGRFLSENLSAALVTLAFYIAVIAGHGLYIIHRFL